VSKINCGRDIRSEQRCGGTVCVPLARDLFRTGWRPAYADGPTVNELVELIRRTLTTAA
jgi:hypothetical protein